MLSSASSFEAIFSLLQVVFMITELFRNNSYVGNRTDTWEYFAIGYICTKVLPSKRINRSCPISMIFLIISLENWTNYRFQ